MIVDPALAGGRDLAWLTAEAIAGGATMIQWRDKNREKGLQLPELEAVRDACRHGNVPLIINDHADLALVVGADGVHLGQKDLPVAAVRPLLPPGWIVGASTNNTTEARAAEAGGASYIAVGNIFWSASKADTRPATLDVLRDVKAAVSVPVCGIGGIDASNIGSVIDAGADIAAVISAVVSAGEPRSAAVALAAAFKGRT
mgnify:FL=1